MASEEEKNPTDEVWEDLKGRARTLVDRLEAGDFPGASELIENLNDTRDRTIYVEVGKLTRGLHDAIRNFDIDPGPGQIDSDDDGESQMTNAQDRLDYVINLTQKAADKTMDMVEEGIPLASSMGDKAAALKTDWERLRRREMPVEEFRDFYHRVDGFFADSASDSGELNRKLNEILMAQDFQDLTGQVIKKVIFLVQEVEDRLVELMRVAGQVEELTGIVKTVDPLKQESKEKQELDSEAEGPQIHADKREDVVSGQDDVDDLLSSLGF